MKMRSISYLITLLLLANSTFSIQKPPKNKMHLYSIPKFNAAIDRILPIFTAILISSNTLCPLTAMSEDWTPRQRLAAETWRAVDENFVDRTFNKQPWFEMRSRVVHRSYTSDEEVYNTLENLLSQLGDRYTRFLAPAQYSALNSASQGQLIGLGVELGSTDDHKGTVILRIEDGSPAQNAALKVGDRIINVDGVDIEGKNPKSPEEVALLMRGPQGSKVSVRIFREKSDSLMDFVAQRNLIKLTGVNSRILKVNENSVIKLIGIRSFSASTRDDVANALEKLDSKVSMSDRQLVVLDLRGNGGGLLQGAVETASLFLPPGKIAVFVVNKDGVSEAKQTISSDASGDFNDRVVVLIDSSTASAAEVFAAALRENDPNRVKIIGETSSFGKGIIQTLLPIGEVGAGLAVTVARYETPLHHNINKVGISPDIKLSCGSSDEELVACLSKFLNAEKALVSPNSEVNL